MLEKKKTLIFVPTYNEKENVGPLCREIVKHVPSADVLLVDDNSPDGTGKIIDELAQEFSQVKARHRSGKLGIGSAHRDGIRYAYENGYDALITMDCDFTHPPHNLPLMLELAERTQCDVAVGSRYLKKDSLKGWNPFRWILTHAGHLLTKYTLKIPYDATSGFRYYNLKTIPSRLFDLISSRGYSFFFESLYVAFVNHFKISELAIDLPPRTYGHSKMDLSEIKRSVKLLFTIYFTRSLFHERFELGKEFPRELINPKLNDEQGWEDYWNNKEVGGRILYDLIAAIYRKLIIKPALSYFIKKTYPKGAKLLHAGCGSGQVDTDITSYAQITGFDISVNALKLYSKVNPNAGLIHGSIFEIPLPNHSVDGVYNLGVMEHFTEEEIQKILGEFKRILKPGAKMVLFWPPEFGISVVFLKGVKWALENVFGKKGVKIHPDEITRIQSIKHVRKILQESGLALPRYHFGFWSFFTYSIVVAETPNAYHPTGANQWDARNQLTQLS